MRRLFLPRALYDSARSNTAPRERAAQHTGRR
jgi:hypothetical protein